VNPRRVVRRHAGAKLIAGTALTRRAGPRRKRRDALARGMIQFVNAASGLIPGQPAEIRFGNGNQAAAYLATGGAGEAVSRLGLASGDQKRPVLLVCGGANDLADPELARASQLLVPAITTAAKVTRAVVADGGTAAGVMQLAGLARTQHRAAIPVLIGIAPAGKITYPGGPEGVGLAGLQEDHSHFILR
jgi:hypothetical protein